MKTSSTIGFEKANNPTLSSRRGRLRRLHPGEARPPAAELPRNRRAQHRPAADRRRRGRGALAAPGRRPVGRRSARRRPAQRSRVRRRARSGGGVDPRRASRLRHEARVALATRPAPHASRPRRRGRMARGQARRRGRRPNPGGHPARRDDELGAGGAAGLADRAPARPRAAGAPSDPDLQILDVRELLEWQGGHVPGSTCVPSGMGEDLSPVGNGLRSIRPRAGVLRARRYRPARSGSAPSS